MAIFVDDIDRCTQGFVVHLLEGIQTLFRGSKITYVVAGDRPWIEASFDKGYEDLSERVGEPGRPPGSLFLQKALQVSLELPPITNAGAYWQALLGGTAGDRRSTEDEVTAHQIRSELAKLKGPSAIDQKLDEIRGTDPQDYSLWAF